MKATVSSSSLTPADSTERPMLAVICDLIKVRLTVLVLLTTLVGFYLGIRGPADYLLLVHTILGTGLLACGAAALNQLLERDHDARMARTASRPLPSGRLQAETVLIFGGACSVIGLIYLATAVNLLTSLLGAATLASYLFIYTPLKRSTWLNTAVGAIPGAIPPLMGWAAVRGELAGEGWALFAILFFWQIPHFLAIAWLYRDEYEEAGFVMLPSVDPKGSRTGHQAVSHTMGLLIASLMPCLLRLAGPVYLCGALVLGLGFLVVAWRFSRQLTRPRARQLFLASILYLPLLLGLMVLDKLKF
jgi:protoheme IX farnesyltransferase